MHDELFNSLDYLQRIIYNGERKFIALHFILFKITVSYHY